MDRLRVPGCERRRESRRGAGSPRKEREQGERRSGAESHVREDARARGWFGIGADPSVSRRPLDLRFNDRPRSRRAEYDPGPVAGCGESPSRVDAARSAAGEGCGEGSPSRRKRAERIAPAIRAATRWGKRPASARTTGFPISSRTDSHAGRLIHRLVVAWRPGPTPRSAGRGSDPLASRRRRIAVRTVWGLAPLVSRRRRIAVRAVRGLVPLVSRRRRIAVRAVRGLVPLVSRRRRIAVRAGRGSDPLAPRRGPISRPARSGASPRSGWRGQARRSERPGPTPRPRRRLASRRRSAPAPTPGRRAGSTAS